MCGLKVDWKQNLDLPITTAASTNHSLIWGNKLQSEIIIFRQWKEPKKIEHKILHSKWNRSGFDWTKNISTEQSSGQQLIPPVRWSPLWRVRNGTNRPTASKGRSNCGRWCRSDDWNGIFVLWNFCAWNHGTIFNITFYCNFARKIRVKGNNNKNEVTQLLCET